MAIDLYVDTDSGNNSYSGEAWGAAKANLNNAFALIPNPVTSPYVVNARGSAADPVAASLGSKSTSAANHITIAGVNYKLEVDGSGGAIALDIAESYVRVGGLWLKATANFSTYFLRIMGAEASDVRVSNCILNGNNPTGAVDLLRLSGQCRVWNTIVYGCGSQYTTYAVVSNHTTGSNTILYNCTIVGGPNSRGIVVINGTASAYNCYASGSSGQAFLGGVTTVNCASSDDTAGTADGCISNVACDTVVGAGHAGFTNVTPGAENFLHKSGSPLVNGGAADPGSGLYADDIIGTSRPQSVGWDIGAFELPAVGGPYVRIYPG